MRLTSDFLPGFNPFAKLSYRLRRAVRRTRPLLNLATFAIAFCLARTGLAAIPTTTSLAALSNGSPAATVTAGRPVVLSAFALSGGTRLTRGQVAFCDAPGPRCSDIHLLGVAQVMADGTAKLTIRPTNGPHTYFAKYTGPVAYDSSMSAPAAVDVTSTYYSFPFLTQASDTLTARVFGQGTVAPTGQVQLTVGGNPFKTAQLVAGKPMIGLDMKALSGPRDLQTLPHLGSGDFNNDGLTDLVAASNNALSIYLSNGDGSFNLLPLVSTPYYNYSLATADFNADGWTDIIAATGIFGRYTILLGHGDGTFEVKQNLLARTQSDVSFRFADFNGDGILDVRADSTYFIGNGDGTFADTAEGTRFADRSPVLPSATSNTAIADFNRDGINDTVSVSSEDRYTVSLCGMDGNCTDTTHPSNVGTVGLVSSADMNGDGIADIVIGHLKGDFPVSVTFQVLFGRGDGTFTDGPVRIFKAHVRALLMGDFNNDGVADLGTLGEQAIRGGATLLFGLGDGTFLPDEAFLITGNFTPVPGRFLTNGLPTFANERQYGEVVVVVSSLSYVSTATFQGALAESGRSVRAHYGGDHVYLSADSDSLLLK